MRVAIATCVLALAAGFWTAALSARPDASAGLVVRVALDRDIDYVDPALAYSPESWTVEYATALKLFNYPNRPGRAGMRLVPEAAAGLPTVSPDGRRYTFRIKPGLRFNTGERVTARSFAHAFERASSRRMGSPGGPLVRDVLSVGIRGRDTLVIRTRHRAPDLVARLSMPFFAAVPPRTPIEVDGIGRVPSAGPYYVESWRRGRQLVLVRNRHYRGPRRGRAERIVFSVHWLPDSGAAAVERGAADVAGVQPDRAADLAARYGVNRRRFFVRPDSGVRWLWLNLFFGAFEHDVRLRRAVAFALDRPAIVRAYGPYSGAPTDQLTVPGTPGYTELRLYPLGGPDLVKARSLAAGSARKVIVDAYLLPPAVVEVVRGNLEAIGLEVEVRPGRGGPCCLRAGDIGMKSWRADYGDPAAFLEPAFHDSPTFPFPRAWRDPFARASRLEGTERLRAFAALERGILTQLVSAVPVMRTWSRTLVSARVGCVLHHPLYGIDYTALCVN